MFERSADAGTAAITAMLASLRGLDSDVEDAVRIDRIRLLEELKATAAAAQVAETAAFAASQRAALTAARVGKDKIGRSITGQVALAKRQSPFHAGRYVGWAAILTSELPHTFRALADGRVPEWRAMLVARETAWLSREHRAIVDREVAPRLSEWGDRQVEAETKKLAYRLDPHGAAAKVRGAQSDRRVTVRPAPETMVRLTALLPVGQGVACYASLRKEADSQINAGDARSRGQLMADVLVQRVTGQAEADAVPVEINLIMPADTMLHPDSPNGNEPAHLDGHGPIPAPVARDLAFGTTATDASGPTEADGEAAAAARWLRRLFTDPDTGELIAMESRRRTFTPGQRRFLQVHDQWCRTPYCGAPIRHADHIKPADAGGPTHVHNGRGTCEACNYTNQSPGWHSRTETTPDGKREVEIITPTGHRYRSRPPDLPGTSRLAS